VGAAAVELGAEPPADVGAGADEEGAGADEEGAAADEEGAAAEEEAAGGLGLMSTPADLHRATAALRAFCWSEAGQLLSIHLVEDSMKGPLEQAHLKSVMPQPVEPRPPVKQVRPQDGKSPRPWPKTAPAAAATIMIEKVFILIELVVMDYRLLKR